MPTVQSGFKKEGGEPFVDFATDYAFRMPAIKVAEAQKEYGDVWMYRYELVTKSGIETGWKASHAFDLPGVFANKDFKFSQFLFDGEPEETADQIIQDMHTPWVRFAKNGEPDPENWPKYTGYVSNVRIFDRETHTQRLDMTELMNVWKDMRFYED
ncbi:MAG: carboxylesterase family protein [Eubacteriales bacterium]|nr:carboxylesterase family protein [Eubacteriales bacterium]